MNSEETECSPLSSDSNRQDGLIKESEDNSDRKKHSPRSAPTAA